MGNDGRRHGSYKPLDLSFPLTPLPAGDDCLAEFMKSRFMKLDSQHIRFVPDCMRENTTKIRNIKQYLKAAFSMPCPLSAAAALPLPSMTWQAAHLRYRSAQSLFIQTGRKPVITRNYKRRILLWHRKWQEHWYITSSRPLRHSLCLKQLRRLAALREVTCHVCAGQVEACPD